MSTKRIIDTSTQNFKKLFDLTKEICVIPEEVNYDSIVQKKSERWNILLDIWSNNKKTVGANIMRWPMEHIMWGFDVRRKPVKVRMLIQSIEDTLLNDDEAFNVWVQSPIFLSALRKETMHRDLLWDFPKFQLACGVYRIFNGRMTIDCYVNAKRGKGARIYDLTYVPGMLQYYHDFKSMLSTLLPGSFAWSDQKWTHYNYLRECIKNTYGADIGCVYVGINPIYYLLKRSRQIPCSVDIKYFLDVPLNYNIVKKIFPNNTDETILELYSDVLLYWDEWESKDKLRKSWLIDIVNTWAYEPEHKYYRKARKAIIDLTMTE